MAYLKPPAFTRRLFNPLAMRFGIGGAVTLSVAGRRTGEARAVPVIPVEQGGVRHLVSARGETEWVREERVLPIPKRSGRLTEPAGCRSARAMTVRQFSIVGQ